MEEHHLILNFVLIFVFRLFYLNIDLMHYYLSWHTLIIRDRSQTLVRGAWCKKYLSRKFFGAPFKPKKKIQGPLFAMKITGQPHRKASKLTFTGKFVVIFFRPPLQGSKILRAPLFTSDPPYKCLWMFP